MENSLSLPVFKLDIVGISTSNLDWNLYHWLYWVSVLQTQTGTMPLAFLGGDLPTADLNTSQLYNSLRQFLIINISK